MPPPTDPSDNPYQPETDYNTNPAWLTDGHGHSALGKGVKADLSGMTDYAGNLDKIKTNFMSLSTSASGSMQDTAVGAFAADNNGLDMTVGMLEMATHNITQLTQFLGNLTQGVENVAMAAQTVANTYGSTDATSAARLNSINFAFGDKGAAPGNIPPAVLKQLQSWSDYQKDNPAPDPSVPNGGVPGAQVVTNGNTQTMTMVVDGKTYKVVTTSTAYSGIGVVTSNTYYDGKLVGTKTVTSGSFGTYTSVSRTVYPTGKAPQTLVESETSESTAVTSSGGTQNTKSTTTYTYDGDGKKHATTTTDSTQVGTEHAPDYSDPLTNDPAQQKRNEIMPPPKPSKDDVILAPGAPGQDYTPSGGTTA